MATRGAGSGTTAPAAAAAATCRPSPSTPGPPSTSVSKGGRHSPICTRTCPRTPDRPRSLPARFVEGVLAQPPDLLQEFGPQPLQLPRDLLVQVRTPHRQVVVRRLLGQTRRQPIQHHQPHLPV